MNASPQLYEELNKAWKSTCRIILGEEIGELKEYEEWLLEYTGRLRVEKSAVSGRDVHLGTDEYCRSGKFISLTEVDFYKKFEPLGVNEVKDIDSIVSAIQERTHYTGEVVLGESRQVENSTNINDSSTVYGSYMVDGSKNVACSKYLRDGEFIFGVVGFAHNRHAIRGVFARNSSRCFEFHNANNSQDAYYSSNLVGCTECFFCFNLRNKRYVVGNLELKPDTYRELKRKLLSELVELLKAGKAPSLYHIISQLPNQPSDVKFEEKEEFDLAPIGEAFKKTYRIILKGDPKPLGFYKNYMLKNIPEVVSVEREPPEGETLVSRASNYLGVPSNRLVSYRKSYAIGDMTAPLTMEEAKKLSFADFQSLSKLAYMGTGLEEGRNSNVHKVEAYLNASNCYFGCFYGITQYSAFSFWPRDSTYVFGVDAVLDTNFAINCYNSKTVTRALECDSCKNSSDIYFSHNCENLRDSMFCFNVKNIKNAIGNSPMPLDEYEKVKASILEQMHDELTRTGDLKWDIFNIGCGGRKA